MRFSVLVAVASLALSGLAQGGAVIHQTERDLPDGKPSDKETIYVQDGMIRSDSLDERGHPTHVMIFRDGVLWDVHVAQRTYSRIDKTAAQQAAQRLQGMSEQMKQMMANLPPERRAAMEQALAGRGQPKPSVYSDAGRSEHVSGFSCELWQRKQAAELRSEYCVSRPGDVPDGDEIYGAVRQMSETLKDLITALSGMGKPPVDTHGLYDFEWLERAKGYPILTRDFEGGKPYREHAVKSIETSKLPADKFAIPQGFREVPALGGGRDEE